MSDGRNEREVQDRPPRTRAEQAEARRRLAELRGEIAVQEQRIGRLEGRLKRTWNAWWKAKSRLARLRKRLCQF